MKGLPVVPAFVHSLTATNGAVIPYICICFTCFSFLKLRYPGTIGENFQLGVHLVEYNHGDLNKTCVRIDFGDSNVENCNAQLNSTACEEM